MDLFSGKEPATKEERAEIIAFGIHLNEMEGARPTPQALADADDYIKGFINADELVARTRKRYGLE